MKGPPFGTALSIVAYWDGLPTPSGVRHAESHALRAHVAVVFAPGRALEWKLISAKLQLGAWRNAGVGALEAAEDFT
jgi:hypothetical protein